MPCLFLLICTADVPAPLKFSLHMNSQASRFTDENAHVQFSQLVKHRTSVRARHLGLKLQLEPSDYPRGRGREREGRGGGE